jgi:hypothetical protein
LRFGALYVALDSAIPNEIRRRTKFFSNPSGRFVVGMAEPLDDPVMALTEIRKEAARAKNNDVLLLGFYAKSGVPKHVAMSWMQRLKRVFAIEIARCRGCGGRLEVIASIEEPELIERILAHRRERGGEEALTVALGARAPPQASLL